MICTIHLMIAGRFSEVKMMDLDQRVMVISGRVLIGSPMRTSQQQLEFHAQRPIIILKPENIKVLLI